MTSEEDESCEQKVRHKKWQETLNKEKGYNLWSEKFNYEIYIMFQSDLSPCAWWDSDLEQWMWIVEGWGEDSFHVHCSRYATRLVTNERRVAPWEKEMVREKGTQRNPTVRNSNLALLAAVIQSELWPLNRELIVILINSHPELMEPCRRSTPGCSG